MRVCVVGNPRSVNSRSILDGYIRAFATAGHDTHSYYADALPDPGDNPLLPELLWSVHGGELSPGKIRKYRDRGIKTALVLLDEPYEIKRTL